MFRVEFSKIENGASRGGETSEKANVSKLD